MQNLIDFEKPACCSVLFPDETVAHCQIDESLKSVNQVEVDYLYKTRVVAGQKWVDLVAEILDFDGDDFLVDFQTYFGENLDVGAVAFVNLGIEVVHLYFEIHQMTGKTTII